MDGQREAKVYRYVFVGRGRCVYAIGPGPYDKVPGYGKEPGFDKNDPLMPVAWTKTYQYPGGKSGKVFATTMGSSNDLSIEGTRRMVVNAVF